MHSPIFASIFGAVASPSTNNVMVSGFQTGYVETPLGHMKADLQDGKLYHLQFEAEKMGLEKLENGPLNIALAAFFKGESSRFGLELMLHGTDFQQSVWALVQEIGLGEIQTYKNIALRLGNKNLIRAVGAAVGRNPILLFIPCHRVVGSDAAMRGYAGEIWRKEWLLNFETGQKNGQGLLFLRQSA